MPPIPVGFDITELVLAIFLGVLSFIILLASECLPNFRDKFFFLFIVFLLTRISIRFICIFIKINYNYFDTAVFTPLMLYLRQNHYYVLLELVNFYLNLI